MGWGKGKGKALHQAELQEERAAMHALARGDIAGAMAHERNAETLAHAEARVKAKAKAKAAERALHRAERQEERAAMNALAHGDVAAAIAHEQKAEALAQAERSLKGKKGKGKGHGYAHPEVVVVSQASVPVAPVVVEAVVVPGRKGHKGAGKAAENALHRAEFQEEIAASASLSHGDVVGAAIHAERAAEMRAAEHAVHREVVREEARRAHHEERRQEHLAARDLAHGNLFGAISHEMKAHGAHNRERKLEGELHHHHHHRGW